MSCLLLRHCFVPVLALVVGLGLSSGLQGQETVCARVSLEVRQEVSLARQAFEARMGITNTLPQDITDVQVTLQFSDEAGNDVLGSSSSASDPAVYFFHRADVSAGGSTEAPHPTTVQKGKEAVLVWTLIPTLTAANAGGATPNGRIYLIGAELRYMSAGKQEIVPINPDFIRVKPLPEIQMDYFLPYDVSGDDPLTPVVEPPVPFSLGLRCRNVGVGTAKDLAIESSPPKILRNEQDAPVQFTIHSTRVNDQTVSPGLVVDAADLASGASAMMRWEMRSRLSGRFTEFTAEVSHSDELGGALTALLNNPSTHRLEGEVLVDLPGRDAVVDFLAWESMSLESTTLRVYESRQVNPEVSTDMEDTIVPGSNINLLATMTGGALGLAGSPTSQAFSYVRATDPWSGNKPIKRVVRSDGKVLPARNAWLSKRYFVAYPGAVPVTEFHVHVFDWLPAGMTAVSWQVEYDASALANHPPVLGSLASRIVQHLSEVTFDVTASDPDGMPVALSLPIRPYGAAFTVDNNGAGTFTWTPGGQGVPQIGDFPLTFQASDGVLTTSRTIVLTVTDVTPIDAWKKRWWPEDDPDSANSADPDADGLTNLYEYALDLDPTRSSTHQRPVLSRVEISGKHYLSLSVVRRTGDPSLHVNLVGSGDPALPRAEWSVVSTGVDVADASTPPGFKRVKFVDSVALEDSPAGRFVRLQVSYMGL